jgi:hypothetical protein
MGNERVEVVAFTSSLHPNADVRAKKYADMIIQKQSQWKQGRDVSN